MKLRANIQVIIFIQLLAFEGVVVAHQNNETTSTSRLALTKTSTRTTPTSTATTTTLKLNDSCYTFHAKDPFYSAILKCSQEKGILVYINMSLPIHLDPVGVYFESNRNSFIYPFTFWIMVIDTDGRWFYSTMTFSASGKYSEIRQYAYRNATKLVKEASDFEAWGASTHYSQIHYYWCYLCQSLSPPSNNRALQSVFYKDDYFWVNPVGKSMIENDVLCGKDGGVLAPIEDWPSHAFAVGIQSSLTVSSMWIGLQKAYQDHWLCSDGAKLEEDNLPLDDDSELVNSCIEISSETKYLFHSRECSSGLPAALCMESKSDCKLKGSIKRLGSCYRNASRDLFCANTVECAEGSQFVHTSEIGTYLFDFLKAWSLDVQPNGLLHPYAATTTVCGCGKIY